MHKAIFVAVALLASTGCKKDPASAACDKYAKLEIECNGAGEGARPTIVQFCTDARAGAKDVTHQLIALESSCAQTAADCAGYKTCVEQKKRDTTPAP